MPRFYYRTGSEWDTTEDEQLKEEIKQNLSIKILSKNHRRSVGSIMARIRKYTRESEKNKYEHTINRLEEELCDLNNLIKEKKEEFVQQLDNTLTENEEYDETNELLELLKQELEKEENKLIMIFDTETTGLMKDNPIFKKESAIKKWKKECRIVQFAYQLHYKTGELYKKDSMIIKPDEYVNFSEKSVSIHGISKEKATKEGVFIEDFFTCLSTILPNVETIVAHNVPFDDAMVKSELMHANRNDLLTLWNSIPKQCTMIISSFDFDDWKKEPKWTKLGDVYTFYELGKLNDKKLHDATYDTQLCSEIYFFLKKRYGNMSPFNLNIIKNNDKIVRLCKQFYNNQLGYFINIDFSKQLIYESL